jgi:hypothetical protein
MPNDIGLWIVVVIAVAAVVALAIWAGNNVVLKFKGFTFQTSDKKDKTAPTSNVKVAEQANVQGDVGRVIGKSLNQSESLGGNVEVGRGMKVGGSVDEIIGVEIGRAKNESK